MNTAEPGRPGVYGPPTARIGQVLAWRLGQKSPRLQSLVYAGCSPVVVCVTSGPGSAVTALARSAPFGLGRQGNGIIPAGGLLHSLDFVNRLREVSQGTSALCQQGD